MAQKTASQIQKERTQVLETKAEQLLQKCSTMTLASINKEGYPRICTVSKIKNEGFLNLYFVTSKRSAINGKATHFENCSKASVCYSLAGDSVTLIGDISFITDKTEQETFWQESDRRFFKKGIDDPKFRLLKFHTIEATFWIEGKFRTCRYK
ncbi:pyridoxamine 5'-phosphate oxidase family protein [Scatolibacter rhodanostii]|uniref:pyridoxamine 5'-phosphate oxidase family protein n=1 Tax=Scatolibacter rhodanostii TaxID=2014781 RepID=UPI000C0780B8|nr:pyridoxamine 5'-phosphate oxidase family protein [Scatolibacter rhodanostii]